MLRNNESLDVLIEYFGIGASDSLLQSTGMALQTIGEGVVAKVLMVLVGISTTGLRGVEQSEAQGVVVGLVPTILTVVHDGHTVGVALVGKVGPLLCRNLVSNIGIVTTLYAADTKVVGGQLIVEVHGELGLEQCIGSLPIHFVIEVDAVGKCTLVETDVLTEFRVTVLLLHAEGLTQCAILYKCHRYTVGDGYGSRINSLLQHFPCGPVERLVLGKQCQAYGLALLHQFALIDLVEDRGDIALRIELNLINGVLDNAGRGFCAYTLGRAREAQIIYSISVGRHGSLYQHVGLAVGIGDELRCHLLALGIEGADPLGALGCLYHYLHHIGSLVAERVVAYDGESLHAGVHLRGHSADRGGQDV